MTTDRSKHDSGEAYLTRLERFVVSRAKKNKLAFVLAVTLPICLVSVGLTTSFLSAFGAFEDPTVRRPALAAGFLIPAVVAPPMIGYLVSIVCRIDEITQKLQRSAHTDPLTNTLNRRGFFSRLAPSPDVEGDAVLVIVDLDDFKTLNDTHGHDLGDRALIEIAEWLETVSGPDGVVGRFGGDEFVCVLPADRAADIAPTAPFEIEDDGRTVSFSASTGQVRLAGDDDLDAALRRADAALYQQKARRQRAADAA